MENKRNIKKTDKFYDENKDTPGYPDSKITTIKVESETKERLERLKEHKRETYNEVIKKILYILNQIRKDPISANRILGKIDSNIRRKEIYGKKENKDSKK
jgi:hypothetical protein